MKKESKLRKTDIFSNAILEVQKQEKQKNIKEDKYITKSFRLPPEMAKKLKYYTDNIAPKHIKVTESEIIRYMIENFNLEEGKVNFFKIKE